MFRGHHFFSYLAPIPLAIIVLLLGIAFTFYPPQLYQKLIGEKDLMFMNIQLLAYLCVCVGSFILGAHFMKYFLPRRVRPEPMQRMNWSTYYLASIPLLVLSLLATILVIHTYLSVLPLNAILSSLSKGDSVVVSTANFKEDVSGTGTGWVSAFATACCAWAFWLWLQKIGSRPRRTTLGILLVFTVIAQYASGILTLTRTPLLQFTIVFGLVWLLNMYNRGKLNLRRGGLIAIISIVGFIGVFSLVERGRGGQNSTNSTIIQSTVGYFPGSYNRLAAIMSGQLHIPNAGSTYYLLNGLWLFPGVQSFGLLDIGRDLGLDLPKDSYSNWIEGFQTVQNARLNGGLTWTTAYGSLYAEIGWWGVIFFLIYGGLSQILWSEFQRGRISGIILYPLFIVSQLQWHATLYITRRENLIAALVIVILTALIRFWLYYAYHHRSLVPLQNYSYSRPLRD